MSTQQGRRGSNAVVLGALGGLAVLVILSVVLWALYSNQGDPGASAGATTGVTLRDILGSPERYYGREVTVAGGVARISSVHVIMVRDRGDDSMEWLPVLLPSPNILPSGMTSADAVRITGTVRPLRTGELGRELGVDLNDDQLEAYQGKPALVARSVTEAGR